MTFANIVLDVYLNLVETQKSISSSFIYKRSTTTPWFSSRYTFNKDAATFTLPINLEALRGLTPLEYITDYLKIVPRRQRLYKKLWDLRISKHRRSKRKDEDDFDPDRLNLEELAAAFFDFWRGAVSADSFTRMGETLNFQGLEEFDEKQFYSVTAFCERFMANEDKKKGLQFKKTVKDQERADFSSFGKFERFKISKEMFCLFSCVKQFNS
ncbi:Oidioi.mRNA.OKI2018_I69.XSR.g14404.t1.cds [Oikopleura dioica]|uniref:Oidioi.mRNA.OKI2018_I69.XSR.g14404.t1.cds n=1 Tax=Oikopleura dioica TaxID=34765 RepID=A0ABN7SGZ8_OIKDI|nr:Oidioi.mRNA.OKI2018_I69.XSR.g14404.t1.cds [Oikopleura dioica]